MFPVTYIAHLLALSEKKDDGRRHDLDYRFKFSGHLLLGFLGPMKKQILGRGTGG